jgi:peptidoglycan/LPS O-acetylase OafA/YrhL
MGSAQVSTMKVVSSKCADYLRMKRIPGGINELDGLRGIAILLVLGRHAIRPFWTESQPLIPVGSWNAGTLLINGWMGVDLFFVLSGFLISHHLIKQWDKQRTGLRSYITKRVLRIVPTYFTVLFIVGFGWVPFYKPAVEDLGLRFTYHILFLQDYFPSDINVAFWSLGVEEKFYLLAPFIMFGALGLRKPLLKYFIFITLFFCPLIFRVWTASTYPELAGYTSFFRVFRSPFHMCFDGLVIGMLSALIYRDRKVLPFVQNPLVAQTLAWGGIFLSLYLLAAESHMGTIDWFDKTILQTLIALGMGSTLLGVLLGGGPIQLLRKSWLFFFSKISYSLYLVHLPLAAPTAILFARLFPLNEFEPMVQFFIYLPVYSALSIFVALILHYVVEKPFLLLKDRQAFPRAEKIN